MIRRPATIISFGDYEVQCLLREIFLRTLPADFDQLRLEDRNLSYGGDTLNDSSDGSSASSNSGSEFDFTSTPDSIPALFCVRNSTGSQGISAASMASTAFPAAAMTPSLHRSVDPSEASATTSPQISTALPRHRVSRTYEQQHETRSLSPHNQRRKENCPRSSAEAKTKAKDGNRHSTSQAYPSSPDAFPELPFSTVPLRALPLSTRSGETVLASAKDSSTAVMDDNWEFGTIQPDSIFEEGCSGPLRAGDISHDCFL